MDINFHIPDFFFHYRLNILLDETMNKKPEWFRDNIKIASSYGVFPTSLWNGGRFAYGLCDERTMKNIIKDYNDRNIKIRFTFTNLLLTEEHLDNKFCNDQLKWADNGFNEVITASPVLEKYIREKYPEYKITSSTCKQIEDLKELEDELEKDYSLVVLDYNWNNNFEILEKINKKDKCEILINACCIPNCPNRGQHYRIIGAELIKYDEWRKNPSLSSKPYVPEDFKCPHKQTTLYLGPQYSTRISVDDLYDKYVPMGYNQFKIEGRTSSDITTLEYYVYYLAKPEYRDAARFYMLRKLTHKYKYFNS